MQNPCKFGEDRTRYNLDTRLALKALIRGPDADAGDKA